MDIAVVGAGYAGTLAANRLARKLTDARITVVNPRPHFVERVRLHQRLAGTARAAAPLSTVLDPRIDIRQDTAEKIGDGTLALENGPDLPFDHLVLAVGSTASPLPHTIPTGTWEGAETARAALAALRKGDTVTVIGTGPTGIETAAEIAESRPDLNVRLIGPALAPTFADNVRDRVRAGLRRLNVDVIEGSTATAATPGGGEDRPGTVRLDSGTLLDSHLTLWSVIGTIPDLARRSGLRVDERGRVLVDPHLRSLTDPHLRSLTDPRILAVGDCAAVPGMRPSCQTAGPLGAYAADLLVRTARGRSADGAAPFSLGYIGTGLSLGRRDAVVQLTHRDDTPRRAHLSGGPATVVKEIASRSAAFGSRTALAGWMPGPR